MRQNHKNLIITLSILACIILIAIIFLSTFFNRQPQSKKNLVVGRYTDALSLDPSIATDSESFEVTVNIFENLVRLGQDGETLLPWLAESWQSSEDGLIWNFDIRPNVYFHDGQPLDAESIAFNFQRWMYEDNPYHTGQFIYWNQSFGGFPGIIKSVNALSEYNLEITLKEPYAPFLKVLSLPPFGISSPSAIKIFNDSLKYNPVGTGPFKLDNWEHGISIQLKRNADYWNKPAKLDTITFKVIDDSQNAYALFRQNALHILEGVNWSEKQSLEQLDTVSVKYKPLLNVSYLALNHQVSPFDDLRVRKAIALLIDRDDIISNSLTPLSKPAETFLPPQSKSYHEGLEQPTRNISEAKALLSEAGHPYGFSTELWVSDTPRDYMTNPLGTANDIQKQLAAAGIHVDIKVLSWKDFLKNVKQGTHPMIISGWNGDLLDPDNFLYTLFHSENTKPSFALNYFFNKNEKLDTLLNQARHTMNEDFRNALYRESQEIIDADVTGIPLVHTMSLCAVSKDVLRYNSNRIGHRWLYEVDIR